MKPILFVGSEGVDDLGLLKVIDNNVFRLKSVVMRFGPLGSTVESNRSTISESAKTLRVVFLA
jgi:hypothetical protein